MKKFLLFFAGLMLAFLTINFLYLLILPKVDWDFSKTKEAHNFNNQELKVLVFGNSTAMDGVNTEIISNSIGPAYNFSVGGASLETNYIQLEDYLNHNAIPGKVLLFLCSAHVNYTNKFEIHPIVDYYYKDYLTTKNLKDLPLFRFRWSFVENFKKLISAKHRDAKIIKGQLQINRSLPDNTEHITDFINCPKYDYNSGDYNFMWKIVRLCRERRILLEVFELPCWKETQNNCNDLKVYNELFLDSITIRNFNKIKLCDTLLDSKKDWLSINHLNHSGSIKVTNEVIKILSSIR